MLATGAGISHRIDYICADDFREYSCVLTLSRSSQGADASADTGTLLLTEKQMYACEVHVPVSIGSAPSLPL